MICKISLRVIYRSNPEVRTFCGMTAALALLPEKDVRLGLENLKQIVDEMPLRTILLLEYVERVYVGSKESPACPVPTLYIECPPSDPSKGSENQELARRAESPSVSRVVWVASTCAPV